jgi:hypothetical protein
VRRSRSEAKQSRAERSFVIALLLLVIPAQAGIQFSALLLAETVRSGIPAYAE